MKHHIVSIFYSNVYGRNYVWTGLVPHIEGDNGKAICYPTSIFKEKFGFDLPDRAMISLL